ncbi:SET domain-containing protein 4 [Entophlyctis luteolus]|nr:SET domain-containing protein 4 [Entophlyctis luteolus]
MATRTILAGTPIISVDAKFLITIDTARAFFREVSNILLGNHLSEHAALAAYLAVHRFARPTGNLWNAYFDMLPRSFETVAANFPSSLQDLLPEYLRHGLMQQQAKTLQRDFEAVRKMGLNIDADDFRWGWFAVNTRCITLNTSIQTNYSANTNDPKIALAPFLDLLNHSQFAKISANFNRITNAFEIVALEDIPRGKECFISYGAHDNAFLLVEYGFAISRHCENKELNFWTHNRFDHLNIDKEIMCLPIPGEKSGVRETIFSELQASGLNYALHVDEDSFRVMNALRLYSCFIGGNMKSQLRVWRKVVQGELPFIDKENEKRANKLLLSICDNLLTVFQDSLELLSQWRMKNTDKIHKIQGDLVKLVLESFRYAPRILTPQDSTYSALWDQCNITPFVHALHSFTYSEETQPPPPPAFAAHPPMYPPVVSELRIVQGEDESFLPPYLFHKHTVSQLEVSNGTCCPGQLSDKGKITMMNFGSRLREKYVDALKFLPEILTPSFNKTNMYIRSTGYVRTVESVQYLLAGLFPFHTRQLGQSADIAIHIKGDENMYIDFTCGKLHQLVEPFKKAAAIRNHALTNELMSKMISKFPEQGNEGDEDIMSTPGSNLTQKSESDRLKLFGIREIDVFYDTLKCIKAAGIPLPRGVTNEELDGLSHVFVESFAGGFLDAGTESISGPSTSLAVKRLIAGRFIGDLMEFMEKRTQTALNDKSAINLGIFSGHDTTILPLLLGLDAATGENRAWPKFAANITVELFEDTSSKNVGAHYVQVRYDDVPLKLSFCQRAG